MLNYNIKGTGVPITDELRGYVEKKLAHAEKFLQSDTTAHVDVELTHQDLRHGDKFCAEFTASAEQKPLAFLCPSGHDWNGSYCTLKSPSGVEAYVANVLSAFMSLIDFW